MAFALALSAVIPSARASQPSPGDLSRQAAKVLAMAQRKPANVDLFPSRFFYSGIDLSDDLGTEGLYLRGSPMSPAPGPIPIGSQVKSQLTSFLKQRFGSNQSEINKALAVFDSSKVKGLIPDYRLRAAFAALSGTSLAPAIQYYLRHTAFFAGGIVFGTLDSVKAPSETRHSYNGTRVVAQVLIASRYQDEPWQLFTALIGHELQHSQTQVTPADEAITNFELAIEYAEILAKHPKLAYLNTELARRLNGLVQLLLNARRPGSAQNVIVASNGRGLFPGSTNPVKDMWTDYTGTTGGGVSPAPSEAKPVLKSLLPGIHLPSPLDYDKATAKLFVHLKDAYLPPTTRLRLAVLLQLVPVSQIAHKLRLTTSTAISRFKLHQILKVVDAGQYRP